MLHWYMIRARADDLHRAGEVGRLAAEIRASSPRRSLTAGSVTLRFAFPDDEDALARLAALDSSDPPPAPVLVADVEGTFRAAVSLADGSVIADPFHPTEALISLLRSRAQQLTRASSARTRGRRSSLRLRHRAAGLWPGS